MTRSISAYEESLVLTDSHEKSTNEEWHFDVSETVEIGGEAYGVSASSSTTVDAGESGGESETDSSSEENATGVSINFELQSGEVVRVNTYFHESRTRQDYDTHAILDFDIEMHFNHWPSSDHKAAIRRNKQIVKVSGVCRSDGLLQEPGRQPAFDARRGMGQSGEELPQSHLLPWCPHLPYCGHRREEQFRTTRISSWKSCRMMPFRPMPRSST